jgi:hypothetical protein
LSRLVQMTLNLLLGRAVVEHAHEASVSLGGEYLCARDPAQLTGR